MLLGAAATAIVLGAVELMVVATALELMLLVRHGSQLARPADPPAARQEDKRQTAVLLKGKK